LLICVQERGRQGGKGRPSTLGREGVGSWGKGGGIEENKGKVQFFGPQAGGGESEKKKIPLGSGRGDPERGGRTIRG